MADRNKVVNELNDCLENQHISFMDGVGDIYAVSEETIRNAIALLKEQEAKQVIRKQCKKEHDNGSVTYFAEWHCPHCKLLILRGFGNPSIKFCYKCGKPVLWEGR